MKNNDKIKWFGIDGLLVLAFFAICAGIFTCLTNKIDFVIGYVIPFVVLFIVTAIFVRYLFTVYKFIKMAGSKNKEN